MVKRLGSHEVRPQIIQQGKRVRTRQLNNPQGEIVKSSTTSRGRALPSSGHFYLVASFVVAFT